MGTLLDEAVGSVDRPDDDALAEAVTVEATAGAVDEDPTFDTGEIEVVFDPQPDGQEPVQAGAPRPADDEPPLRHDSTMEDVADPEPSGDFTSELEAGLDDLERWRERYEVMRSKAVRYRDRMRKLEVEHQRLKRIVTNETMERIRLGKALKSLQDRASTAEEESRLVRERADEEQRRGQAREARLQQDIEGMAARRRRERDDQLFLGRTSVLGEVLPVVDHLQMALDHASADPTRIVDGVRIVLEQIRQAFTRIGLEEVAARPGDPFLPEVHEAVSHIGGSGRAGGGAIVEMHRAGYTLGGRLVRAARVTVSGDRSDVATEAEPSGGEAASSEHPSAPEEPTAIGGAPLVQE